MKKINKIKVSNCCGIHYMEVWCCKEKMKICEKIHGSKDDWSYIERWFYCKKCEEVVIYG